MIVILVGHTRLTEPFNQPIILEKNGGTSCNVMQIRRSSLLVPPFCVSRTVNQNRKKIDPNSPINTSPPLIK